MSHHNLGHINAPVLICGGAYGNLEALEALLPGPLQREFRHSASSIQAMPSPIAPMPGPAWSGLQNRASGPFPEMWKRSWVKMPWTAIADLRKARNAMSWRDPGMPMRKTR